MESLDKPYLRSFYREQRKKMDQKTKNDLDLEIASRFLMTKEYRDASTILLYMAKNDEINTLAILFASLSNGKTVAVPKCIDNKHMLFYRINSIRDLELGFYRLMEPKRGLEQIKNFENTVCITPCFCIDLEGHRVGHGAGYYDMFFKETYDRIKVALAYTNSVLPRVNYDEFDVPVNMIVTDTYTRYITDKEN